MPVEPSDTVPDLNSRRPSDSPPVRLLAVAASPVFYQLGLYRQLAVDPRIDFEAVFLSNGGIRPFDAGFGGQKVVWDEDLLADYHSSFVRRADSNGVLRGFFAMRDWDLFARLLREEFDVLWIHGYSYLTMWLAIAAALIRRKPLLIREEQTLLHERPWYKAWIRDRVLRLLFRRASGLFIGTNNRAFFEYYGVPRPRLFWVPYSTENDRLQATAAELAPRRSHLQRRFGITPGSGPIVLFVGKLMAKKQPLLLLKAFAAVRARYPCHLLFVGDGELRGELEAIVTTLSVPDVHIAGFLNRTEIHEAFAAADIFALPSAFHETWGLVVNEAMNFGLPIVVTDKVGSAVDLVHHGRNGFVVRTREDELVDALSRLVGDPDLRGKLGCRSIAMIRRWTHARAAEGVAAAALAAAGR